MLKLKELTVLLNCRRLFKKTVSCHHRLFPFVPPSAISTFVPPSAISRKRNPNFFASARVRNPSRCIMKRSAVLFFVSTRLTDGRFSRIHCCIDKHRISMCLSPPGPLRCRMCLAESESIWKFLEEFSESQQFSGVSTGCVELCFTRTETELQSASDFGCTSLRSVHRNDIP